MGIVEETAKLAEQDDEYDLFADTDDITDDGEDDGTDVDEVDESSDGDDEDTDEDPFEDSDEDEDDTEAEDEDVDTDLHVIRVGGKDIEVSYDELIKMAQQGEDYTRKTQLLAEDRKRVATWEQLNEAFNEDPEGTLRALAKQFDIDLGASTESEVPEGWDPNDPLEAEVLELRREIRAMKAERESEATKRQAADSAAAVARDIEAVKTEFGVEFDDEALLQYAIDNQIGTVRGAYLAMEAEQARSTRNERPQRQRKRNAPPIEGGRPRSKRLNKPGPAAKMDFESAFEAAMSDHRR